MALPRAPQPATAPHPPAAEGVLPRLPAAPPAHPDLLTPAFVTACTHTPSGCLMPIVTATSHRQTPPTDPLRTAVPESASVLPDAIRPACNPSAGLRPAAARAAPRLCRRCCCCVPPPPMHALPLHNYIHFLCCFIHPTPPSIFSCRADSFFITFVVTQPDQR